MFTKWSKGAVFVMGVLAVLLFTLTPNVIFEPATSWAGDGRDTASETADASKEAQGKLADAAGGTVGFFGSIWGWIQGVTHAINKMWGMENGSGVAMVVNGMFYLLLLVIFAFAGKMVINIIKDAIGGKVDEKFQKPSFRKK